MAQPLTPEMALRVLERTMAMLDSKLEQAHEREIALAAEIAELESMRSSIRTISQDEFNRSGR